MREEIVREWVDCLIEGDGGRDCSSTRVSLEGGWRRESTRPGWIDPVGS